jgi:hypothetical protein
MVSKVKLKLFKVGDPGTITVSIKATSEGKPTGASLCLGTIEGSVITEDTNGEYYEITLGDGYTFDVNTQYSIEVKAPDGDINNKVSWRADTSSPTYAGGTVCTSSDSGVDWGTISGADFMFEEWGVGEASPTTVVWGNLYKSQISAEKIEEAILRMIQDHEDDPDAHLEEGESLYSHKASEIIDHIIQSIVSDKIKDGEVWERHRHSFSAWKRLIAMWPEKALLINKLVYTGTGNEQWFYDITFDGTYIYAVMGNDPAVVLKIDPATMTQVDKWTNPENEGWGGRITFDGTYIYITVGGDEFGVDPGSVKKIDPEDMSLVDTWTGGESDISPNALLFDGVYLYVGFKTTPAKVIKIDPSDMSTVSTWTGGEGENDCNGLAFDGNYIYASIYTTPAKVIKIDPSDMTTDDTWTGDTGENQAYDLTFDGTYIYASFCTSPGKVIKIDPSDMTTEASWTGAVGEVYCMSVSFDGSYIYTTIMGSPGKIKKINPSDMSLISTWTGASGEDDFISITFDGNFLYFGGNVAPAKIIRKIIRDIDETGT